MYGLNREVGELARRLDSVEKKQENAEERLQKQIERIQDRQDSSVATGATTTNVTPPKAGGTSTKP
jgi:seryl-tRNA synthetase